MQRGNAHTLKRKVSITRVTQRSGYTNTTHIYGRTLVGHPEGHQGRDRRRTNRLTGTPWKTSATTRISSLTLLILVCQRVIVFLVYHYLFQEVP